MTELSERLSGLLDSEWAILALIAAAILIMYLGRAAAHAAIIALGSAIQTLLEVVAGALLTAQEKILNRNREVLLEIGRQEAERQIEREFERVHTVVQRDLSAYPALHRKLADQITQIDEDYQQATDVPPTPAEWTSAVESLAAIPSSDNPLIGRILSDIQKTLEAAQKKAVGEYRAASGKRHALLKRMLPYWRTLDSTLGRVGATINGLQDRVRAIDQQMEKYQEICAKSDNAVRMLSASSMTVFVSSTLVLLIATMGAFINFHLIALPMSEMVGAASYVGPIRMSDIAALVIITTELAMGLFLLESLGITRLFPVINSMDDRMRRRMVWISFGILLTLACVESSLAYMRDLLAADREALNQALAASSGALSAGGLDARLRWIPSVGQMVMGFMLPFALAFAAIPLESFIQSTRIVAGAILAFSMRGTAAVLELTGGFAKNLTPFAMHLYDFVIIVPLRVEQAISRKSAGIGEHETV